MVSPEFRIFVGLMGEPGAYLYWVRRLPDGRFSPGCKFIPAPTTKMAVRAALRERDALLLDADIVRVIVGGVTEEARREPTAGKTPTPAGKIILPVPTVINGN